MAYDGALCLCFFFFLAGFSMVEKSDGVGVSLSYIVLMFCSGGGVILLMVIKLMSRPVV
jgi:hypothetical protein